MNKKEICYFLVTNYNNKKIGFKGLYERTFAEKIQKRLKKETLSVQLYFLSDFDSEDILLQFVARKYKYNGLFNDIK